MKKLSEQDGEQVDEEVLEEIEKVFSTKSDMNENEIVRIVNMGKTYYSWRLKSTHALHGVNLFAKKGTCLAILGHNGNTYFSLMLTEIGAGKTTLISCLTDLHRPSFGEAFFFGKRMSTHMHDIQKMIGVCTQFDILWDQLTAVEVAILSCYYSLS